MTQHGSMSVRWSQDRLFHVQEAVIVAALSVYLEGAADDTLCSATLSNGRYTNDIISGQTQSFPRQQAREYLHQVLDTLLDEAESLLLPFG